MTLLKEPNFLSCCAFIKGLLIYIYTVYFKGMVPNLINVSHGTIQFVVYEELKARRAAAKNEKIVSYLTFSLHH